MNKLRVILWMIEIWMNSFQVIGIFCILTTLKCYVVMDENHLISDNNYNNIVNLIMLKP